MPTLCRLSLCLMASAAVHAGVAFYTGASYPFTVGDGRSAVVVELIPTADDSSFDLVDSSKNFTGQDAAVAEPATTERTPPATPASAPSVKPQTVKPQEKTVVRQVTDVMKNRAETAVPTEPACLEPRQGLPDHPAEVVSITGAAAASSQSGSIDVSAHSARSESSDKGLAAAGRDPTRPADGPHGGALIEAMPNYRNNPLPEYPLIARQRHWQGVVWLLVEVSAQGLVDDVDLEQSCGYRVLDRAASRAVQSWEFTPAQRAGVPVASQVRIPVRFSLEGS